MTRVQTCALPICFSIPSSLTQDNPIGFGRNGDLVANTPHRLFPPSLGGRTVGLQFSLTTSENSQISHRCEYSSSPFSASSLRYSGSNTIVPFVLTSPDCLGIPNFVGKSVWILAIYSNFFNCSAPYSSSRYSFNLAISSLCPASSSGVSR